MKKILFGSAAAICAVVGFSSFKNAHNTGTLYYFFSTDATVAPSGAPAIGKQFNHTNLDANPYQGNETLNTILTETTSGCAGGSNWCSAVFTANQVVPTSTGSSIYKLITVNGMTSITQPNREFVEKP